MLCRAKDSLKLDSNAMFFFIDGLGGLGRSLAREFVASGPRHIAFISRSGNFKPEARAPVCGPDPTEKQGCGGLSFRSNFLLFFKIE